jgi:hypothetical protein
MPASRPNKLPFRAYRVGPPLPVCASPVRSHSRCHLSQAGAPCRQHIVQSHLVVMSGAGLPLAWGPGTSGGNAKSRVVAWHSFDSSLKPITLRMSCPWLRPILERHHFTL